MVARPLDVAEISPVFIGPSNDALLSYWEANEENRTAETNLAVQPLAMARQTDEQL